MKFKLRLGLVLLTSAVLVPEYHASAASSVKESHFEIEIRESGSANALYTGGKTISTSDQGMVAVIWFRGPDRGMLQSETVDFAPGDFRMRAYAFDNVESGESLKISVEGKRAVIKQQVASGDPVKETELAFPDGAISFELLTDFISSKWTSIQESKNGFNFPLFLTSRKEIASFKATVSQVAKNKEANSLIEVKSNTWYMSRFVMPMVLEISEGAKPAVVKISRLNPVRSGKFKDKIVDVFFKSVSSPPNK